MSEPTLSEVLRQLEELRKEIQELRTNHPVKKSPCQGVTGKGTPCRNGALPGTQHCRMHSREPKTATAPPRVRKEPKPKKIVPEHSHPIDEIDAHCPLCETHGNVIDPSLPDHTFSCSDDLATRLREILSSKEV